MYKYTIQQGGLKTKKITIYFKHLVIMVLLYVQNRNSKKKNQILNFQLPGSQFENKKNGQIWPFLVRRRIPDMGVYQEVLDG